jgi:hypothetical protein
MIDKITASGRPEINPVLELEWSELCRNWRDRQKLAADHTLSASERSTHRTMERHYYDQMKVFRAAHHWPSALPSK